MRTSLRSSMAIPGCLGRLGGLIRVAAAAAIPLSAVFAAPAAADVSAYQPFSTYLFDAQSRNHLLGEFATGSEDRVDTDGIRLGATLDVADFSVAQTPVRLSLIGQYSSTEVEVSPPAGGDVDTDVDTLTAGAKGTWTVPAVRALNLSAGGVIQFVDVDGPGGADRSDEGVVVFGSARYAVSNQFNVYGTALVSTEDEVQDGGVIAGVLYDLGGLAVGAEVSTPDDTTITPYITWAVAPALRLNAGLTTGGDPDPVFRGQIAWFPGQS